MNKLLSSLRHERAVLIVGILWALIYFIARGLLEAAAQPAWQRVMLALLPILPFGLFLVAIVLDIRRLDELHLRVQLEALALAFPFSILVLMTLGLVGQALDLSVERHVWHYLPVCYFVGLAIAWSRYR